MIIFTCAEEKILTLKCSVPRLHKVKWFWRRFPISESDNLHALQYEVYRLQVACLDILVFVAFVFYRIFDGVFKEHKNVDYCQNGSAIEF